MSVYVPADDTDELTAPERNAHLEALLNAEPRAFFIVA